MHVAGHGDRESGLTRTEFGSKTDLNAQVGTVQTSQTTPLGAWKQLGLSDLAGVAYPGHSLIWAVSHLDKDAYTPLGFATELPKGSPDEPVVGGASVSYVLTPK